MPPSAVRVHGVARSEGGDGIATKGSCLREAMRIMETAGVVVAPPHHDVTTAPGARHRRSAASRNRAASAAARSNGYAPDGRDARRRRMTDRQRFMPPFVHADGGSAERHVPEDEADRGVAVTLPATHVELSCGCFAALADRGGDSDDDDGEHEYKFTAQHTCTLHGGALGTANRAALAGHPADSFAVGAVEGKHYGGWPEAPPAVLGTARPALPRS